MKCPACGAELSDDWVPTRSFAFGDTSFSASPVSVSRRRPARAATFESDVLVPLVQSLVSGFISGLTGYGVSTIRAASRPGLIAVVSFCAGFAISWAILLSNTRQLLWEIETITNSDLDGDGEVGEPIPHTSRLPQSITTPSSVRVELIDPSHTRYQFLNLDIPPDTLYAIAEATLTRDIPFTRRALSHLVTTDQYTALISEMLRGGLLYQRGDDVRSGVELTASGRAMFRKVLSQSQSQGETL